MPTSPSTNGDTGFAYIEAFPLNAPTQPVEGGFFYNKGTDHYTDYYSDSLNGFKVGNLTISDGDQVFIELGQGIAGSYPYYVGDWSYTVSDETTQKNDFHDETTLPPGMSRVDCCLFTRMTTIGQHPGVNDFSDGFSFMNMAWHADDLQLSDASGFHTEDGWVGSQDFPPNPLKIFVNYVDTKNETDTIDLCIICRFQP